MSGVSPRIFAFRWRVRDCLSSSPCSIWVCTQLEGEPLTGQPIQSCTDETFPADGSKVLAGRGALVVCTKVP